MTLTLTLICDFDMRNRPRFLSNLYAVTKQKHAMVFMLLLLLLLLLLNKKIMSGVSLRTNY